MNSNPLRRYFCSIIVKLGTLEGIIFWIAQFTGSNLTNQIIIEITKNFAKTIDIDITMAKTTDPNLRFENFS
jgi:hypothetical protein